MFEHPHRLLPIPPVGLGTWKIGRREIGPAVDQAIRLGYRHVDTASSYGTEKQVGAALAELTSKGIVKREDLWLTSKLSNSEHAPEDVRPAVERSLADLGTDYLDAFLVHWPVATAKGVWVPRKASHMISLDELPLAETWQAMEDLVHAGLVRHIGVSNFSIPKLRHLLEEASHGPEINQIELHPYLQQDAMLAFCMANDIQLMAYSPLGSGDRPKPLKQKDEPILLEDPAITAIATARGVSPARILIAWAVHRGTAAIPKAADPAHMEDNLAAAELRLTGEEISAISELDRNRRYVDGSFYVVPDGPYSMASLWDD